MKLKSSFLIVACAQIYSFGLGFVFRVLLAREVGAETLGLYQLIMPVYSVVMSVCAYGLTAAVQRVTAERPRTSAAAVRAALCLFFALAAGIAAFTAPLSDWISVNILGDARCRLGILLLLPCVMFTGVENILKNYFYGVRRVIPPAVSEVVEQTARTFAALALLHIVKPSYKELAVGVVVLGMVICEVISSSMLVFFYIKRKSAPDECRAAPRIYRELVSIAAPVSVAALAGNLLGAANTIIIPARLIASGLGQTQSLEMYGTAFGMTAAVAGLPLVFAVPFALTVPPRLAALKNAGGVTDLIRKTLLSSMLIIVPACLLLIPFGEPAARFLFKSGNVGELLAPLAVTQVFACLQYLTGGMMNALGRQTAAAANVLITDAAQLGMTWVLTAMPEFRLWGAVFAMLVTTALCAGLNLRVLLRR